MNTEHPSNGPSKKYEPDWNWRTQFWKHPYFLFFVLNIVLLLFLVFMGWLAVESGWIPDRT